MQSVNKKDKSPLTFAQGGLLYLYTKNKKTGVFKMQDFLEIFTATYFMHILVIPIFISCLGLIMALISRIFAFDGGGAFNVLIIAALFIISVGKVSMTLERAPFMEPRWQQFEDVL